MSEGNAHPFSWSSIINGRYDKAIINEQGYPGVSDYLDANADTLGIDGARVTQIWTQDRKLSSLIASSAGIESVVQEPNEMIGLVDAVILARDDAGQHRSMARCFIEAGIPLFIDKPLCLAGNDLAYFAEASSRGKLIMSCSSMRYAVESRSVVTEKSKLGKIELVTAVAKKDWWKYGVHMVEAVMALLGDPLPLTVTHAGSDGRSVVIIGFEKNMEAVIQVYESIGLTFQIGVYGTEGWRHFEIKNYYAGFRETIMEFVRSVREGMSRIPFKNTAQIIKVMIAAEESLRMGGKKIKILP